MPSCDHTAKTLHCKLLTREDIDDFHERFYANDGKILQDQFILLHCIMNHPLRANRPKNQIAHRKNLSIQYHVRQKSGNVIQVCQHTFINVLRISKDRIQRICRRKMAGKAPTELRGGDRVSAKYAERRSSVYEFIKEHAFESLKKPVVEMWRSYNAEAPPELQVKSNYYRTVFNEWYEASRPKVPSPTDCSVCGTLRDKIESEQNVDAKEILLCQQRIHNLRGIATECLMENNDYSRLTLSFTFPKVFRLPFWKDVSTTSGLNLYLFGIVHGSDPIIQQTYLYAWSECDRPKGCNEIASALYNHLCTINLTNVTSVRMMTDGLGGALNYAIIIGMCSNWLASKAPEAVECIEIIIPVAGHAQTPAHKVLDEVVKTVEAKDHFVDLSEYMSAFKEHGISFHLGKDECPVYDWKSEYLEYIKPPDDWHFNFVGMKRFIITREDISDRVCIRGEPFYQSSVGKALPIALESKLIIEMEPRQLSKGVRVRGDKMADIEYFLEKRMGPEWRSINYLRFFRDSIAQNDSLPMEEDDLLPEYHSEEVDFRI